MSTLPPIESFLTDISPSLPSGETLRYDEVYDDIKEAQRADDDLPQGIWVQDLKISDWSRVQDLCVEALQKQTKDVQICAWLIESWMFLHGLEGVDHGFDLLNQLSQKYWETLHPEIEENGDLGFRFSSYVWINEKLSERLKFIHITEPEDPNAHPVNFAQYLEVKMYWGADSSIPGDKQDLVTAFESSVFKTKLTFFQTLQEECRALTGKVKTVEAFLEEKCGAEEAPTLQRFRQVLEDIIDFCAQAMTWKGKPEAPQVQASEDTSAEIESDLSSSPVPVTEEEPSDGFDLSSVVKSREEAYQVIRQAADYLERLDPHSPAPHMVKRAVAWGNMPLQDLLQEIIKEPQALGEVQKLLGLSDGQDSSQQSSGAAPNNSQIPQPWLDPTKRQS